jgi:hypothetical protein
MRMLSHRARYSLLGARGEAAGVESLEVAVSATGATRIDSALETSYPAPIKTVLAWDLTPGLGTRLLRIESTVRGEAYEVEIAVTGNGVLMHRVAPEGPSQVELGWGPDAEFDYLSAAFTAVTVARSGLTAGRTRVLTAVQISADDLEPMLVTQEWRATDEATLECLTRQTGHRAAVVVGAAGEVRSYEGLLELESVDVLPTK